MIKLSEVKEIRSIYYVDDITFVNEQNEYQYEMIYTWFIEI